MADSSSIGGGDPCDSKRIVKVSLYSPKYSLYLSSKDNNRSQTRIKAYHLLFIGLYIFQLHWCITTIGLPYRQFLERAEREGFEVMEGTAQMRAELKHAMVDLHDSDRRSSAKVGWFDWMEMDIEEHAELKRKERLKNVLDALPKKMRVPPKYMPSFWSLLGLGIFVTLHLFVILLQHWSVAFQLLLNYSSVSSSAFDNLPDDEEYEQINNTSDKQQQQQPQVSVSNTGKTIGSTSIAQLSQAQILVRGLPTHARVTPDGKKDVLLPIVYQPTLGPTFEYHRRKFVWDEQNYWRKVRCFTKMKLSFFEKWQGYLSDEKVNMARIRYGKNEFDVKQPTFKELYKAQLTSPFTVFQLFCVVLWMLDEYWQYSAFTFFMILTFEATVVFSRIKSMSALRGMGNKSRLVHVFRHHQWILMPSSDLLPGDIFSLTRNITKNKSNNISQNNGEPAVVVAAEEGGDMVPVDALLLRGFTVVNEASLTGESVPQMKEGISSTAPTQDSEDEGLSIKGKDKNHVLYAGTKLLQCKMDVMPASSGDGENNNVAVTQENNCAAFIVDNPPPDNGCICFVLRTGFSSAQGKLVRMIEGSQEKVKGHERETGLLLCMLFFFALASSGYVLKKGMENENRSKYELLLHCILILTSVIPPELPMQMAVAVNNSLMTLMRMQVFCTEPFRVPVAGKLDCCLFDKTGTLTTDELVAVGVHHSLCKGPLSAAASAARLTPMTQVQNEAGLVLAGCHSLVIVDDEVTGDPLEAAALSAMRWRVTCPDGKVTPALPTEKRKEGKPLCVLYKGTTRTINVLEIIVRHHFSSKLQRMSCVVRDNNNNTYSVSKGSPEAIGALLKNCPEGFDAESKALAKEGYRVIALAYKTLDREEEQMAITSRASCERDLIFAGFIAFTCRVRKDTRDVLERLKEGGLSIAMITGDALLTAAHVAKEVGICDSDVDDEPKTELQALLIRKRKQERKEILMLEPNESLGLYWLHYKDESVFTKFEARSVSELAKKYDLMTTGKSLALAFEEDVETRSVLQYFKVFARMKPDEKETVIECLHSVGLLCLMCGDGANDVGALKQADVGVALLTGFGDVNVDKGLDGNDKKDPSASNPTAMITAGELEAIKRLPVGMIKGKIRSLGIEPDDYPDIVEKDDLMKLYRIKATEVAVKQHDWKMKVDKAKMTSAETRVKQKQEMLEKQKRMMERIKELEEKGESYAHFKALKEFMSNEFAHTNKKKAEMAKLHTIEGSSAMLAAQLEDLETGELPMVKLGDASVAAPFTSKMPSIRSCVDIIRQGRCTLVTSIQMYQILALNCLISAYSLSVLYLDGVKYGDTQMTAMGILGSISFMSVSRSKPLDKLSSVRPLSSIFHPSLIFSLLGQFSMHLTTMLLATREAKKHLPTDYQAELEGVFKPGILNSVVFLVSSVQQVTVFVVNLQGKPFMTGLTENRPLLWSLLSTFILTFMFASESVPGLNKYFQLVPFPDEAFRSYILTLLVADVLGAFLFDRIMKFIFAPQILFASFKGTTLKDVFGLIRTLGVICLLMYMILGNNETWEDMLREQERLDGIDEGTITANATEIISQAILGPELKESLPVFNLGEF